MKNDKDKKRISEERDSPIPHNQFIDAGGLQKPSDRTAYVTLSSFLSGVASVAYRNIIDPDKGGDYLWLLKKAIYAVLIIGGALLGATLIQFYFQ